MKKIINGRKYDTDTATWLTGWSNNYGTSDLKWCSENLYKKKTGEFFLHGEGGPMSPYSRSTGNNTWSDGCGIIPMSILGAKEWVEQKANAAYESIFGEVEE